MSSSTSSPTSSSVSRLFDYFVIVGLDESSGLEVLQSYDAEPSNDLTNCWSPLERSYKPKILAHYPDNVAENPFDHDAVRNLCLPSGLIFRTQKHGLEASFHPFVITRENGSRTFGFSNVFYEEVRSQHVISAIQTLQAMHLTELSTAKSYHERRAMQSKNFRNGSAAVHAKAQRPSSGRSHDLGHLDDSNTRSLPRHFKLAAQKGNMSLSTVQNFYDASKDRLYVTKGIALISPLPFVQLPKHFLIQLTRLIGSGRGDLSLESYVHNLLWDVPVPPPGRSLSYNSFGQSLVLSRPTSKELPFLDYSIGHLFRLLDVPLTLQLFTCMLLENQILLYSKDLYRLMVVAECLTGLLYPFLWQHVYVPILPSTLHHFLDAPVPFIMGLHAQATECQEDLPVESNLCFVDIDGNRLVVPEDLPTFPHTPELTLEILSVLREYGVPIRNRKGWSERDRNNRNWSYGKRRGRATVRKSSEGSWSQDSDSGMSSNEEPLSLNSSQINITMTQSHQSEALRSLLTNSTNQGNTQMMELDYEEGKLPEDILKLNNALRQIFFNRFVHIFSTYEHFVIQPDQDNGRILVHNFDKATFLSDQPDDDLPFLSRFLETQMFASLIDRKIVSISSGETDPTLVLFEDRIKTLRHGYGESLVRTPSYEPCRTIEDTQETLLKRFRNPDIRVPLPQPMNSEEETFPQETISCFPILSKKLLNFTPPQPRSRRLLRELSSGIILKERMRIPPGIVTEYPSLRSVFVPTETNCSPASIAQANWEFVKQLLQECKAKTKRMLVEKMGGEEAVALGHGDLGLVGLEEKTLVGSLCDLLERIWAHGLHVKSKGRSQLWNFLTNYEEAEAAKDTQKPLDPQFLSPDLSARAVELSITPTPNKKLSEDTRSHSSSDSTESLNRARRVDIPRLKPLTVSIATDMRNIQAIREIKTEIGYARAWIRLSLEKKVLSKHLRALLSDAELLRGFYKRTAFLRSEEEREQFLYHILTLNAVDYYSFTNTYTNIILPYRVLVFPTRRTRTIPNLWIIVSGTLGETSLLPLPKDNLEFVFQQKNLGILLSIRIGHDDSGLSSKFHLDHVIVRNEVTGFTRKFPCGRWLGRDVEDGSTERLLLGEPMGKVDDEEQVKLQTPPRARSPSVPRRFYEPKPSLAEIQTGLGEVVIRLVKYYAVVERDRGSLPVLLCGEQGLVRSLELVFQYGFKSSRLFTRHCYIWDYLLRVSELLEVDLEPEEDESVETDNDEEDATRSFVELTQKVQSSAQGLGKEGKFQLFICLSAREHILHRLPEELASCTLTTEMYERDSFLRDPHLLSHLTRALEPLDHLNIRLDNSLSKGIE